MGSGKITRNELHDVLGNKIDGITDGATKVETSATNGNIKINDVERTIYTHPSNHSATIITQDSTHRFVTDTEKSTWNNKYDSSNAYTKTEVDTRLATKSDTTHNHDGRYYTESQTDTLLANKSDTTHIHDDRYYTESETNTLLANKSDISHTHDDRYYTETETNTLLANKSDTSHTHASVNYAVSAGNADTVNNIQFRINGGQIEYFDGGVWKSVNNSTIAFGKSRTASAATRTQTGTDGDGSPIWSYQTDVWITVVDINGVAGRIELISLNKPQDYVNSDLMKIKVTIDGVTEELTHNQLQMIDTNPISGGYTRYYLSNFSGGGSDSGYVVSAPSVEPIYFKSSFKVEVLSAIFPYHATGNVTYRLPIGTA